MRKYSVIVFDLGNVLIPFDYNIMLTRLNEVQSGLGNKFMQLYKDNYAYHRSFERGEIDTEVFISTMLGHCDNQIDSETFCRYYSEIFVVNDDVAGLLPVLKEKGYTLVLLSNTNEIHQQYGYRHYDFFAYFDRLILSHEVKAVKPEEAIYRAVEKYTGRPSEEHIFIDDVREYGDAAKSIGWDAIQFTNYDQLAAELKTRCIL